ncbi:hypothetical protein A4D02_18290 [Niastella koreensis]|uniref:HEAT repeat domain-containing protein n=2 Tax=Niastella koreensis TaxID=354356 RepID=G8TA90_NIAKG|nr:HEAT repeat domain-containing protein [Niastella koreensis]AEV97037.1 hypothetical protein Niako_0652 [Niastella koreensis GR20-10]OQP39273.1 hypothetical protein A4D02_18290 [Niastella koreensis]
MQITETIKARSNSSREQALMLLDMVPLSDTENKYNLLASAGHYLNDAEVLNKWISIAVAETDTRLRADMLYRITGSNLQAIPDPAAFMQLLVSVLQQDEGRDTVLWLLGKLSLSFPAAKQPLIAFYQQHNNADTRRSILNWLLIPKTTDETDLAFFNSILHETDSDDKRLVIARLLLHDKLTIDQITQLLQPMAPPAIKELVLRYCIDRSIVPEVPLSVILRIDPEPRFRHWAILLLAVHSVKSVAVLDAIMYALKNDQDARVREAALHVFGYSISLTPEVVGYLNYCLGAETDTKLALQLLQFLAPHTSQSPELTDGLYYLLQQDLHASVSLSIYDILGRLVPTNPAMQEKFIQAYEKEQRDDAKAVILKALSNTMGDRHELYLKSLRSPATGIREWAIQGLLMMPVTRENVPIVVQVAPALLQPELRLDLRRRLARKLSVIPNLPAETIAVFVRLNDHERDGDILRSATLAQEKAISQSGAAGIDWDQWLHKADVSNDLNGIFPHIWFYFQENPDMAKKVLYACMNPANGNALYAQNISEADILEFMIANFGIDEDLIRYAISHLLQADLRYNGMLYHYLLIIKSYPFVPELQPALWQLLELRGYRNGLNLIQFDELLRIIYGADLENQFKQRIAAQQTANGMMPYLQYISVNNNWRAAPAVLKSVLEHHAAMLDDTSFASLFKEACRNAGVDADRLIRTTVPPPTQEAEEGPGFAD